MRRILATLGLAALLVSPAAGKITESETTVTMTSGNLTANTDLPTINGIIRLVRVIVPDFTGTPTMTLAIRDEDDATVTSKASIAENATSFIHITDFSGFADEEFIPVRSKSFPSTSAWSLLVTSTNLPSEEGAVVVTFYIEE